MKFHTFTVTGRNQFPLDMLRYDCAWPATTDDAFRLLDREADHARTLVIFRMGGGS